MSFAKQVWHVLITGHAGRQRVAHAFSHLIVVDPKSPPTFDALKAMLVEHVRTIKLRQGTIHMLRCDARHDLVGNEWMLLYNWKLPLEERAFWYTREDGLQVHPDPMVRAKDRGPC